MIEKTTRITYRFTISRLSIKLPPDICHRNFKPFLFAWLKPTNAIIFSFLEHTLDLPNFFCLYGWRRSVRKTLLALQKARPIDASLRHARVCCETTRLQSWCRDSLLITSSRFAVSFQGIIRLCSTFIFSRWFKLAQCTYLYVSDWSPQWWKIWVHQQNFFVFLYLKKENLLMDSNQSPVWRPVTWRVFAKKKTDAEVATGSFSLFIWEVINFLRVLRALNSSFGFCCFSFCVVAASGRISIATSQHQLSQTLFHN